MKINHLSVPFFFAGCGAGRGGAAFGAGGTAGEADARAARSTNEFRRLGRVIAVVRMARTDFLDSDIV